MADAKKFIKPERKSYSTKKMLTQDRLMQSMTGLRDMQTELWKTMPDDQYAQLEEVFDTAIACMMAHMCGVKPAGRKADEQAEQDTLAPAT